MAHSFRCWDGAVAEAVTVVARSYQFFLTQLLQQYSTAFVTICEPAHPTRETNSFGVGNAESNQGAT